jgi:glucosamine--fructose-6-phosphate aminotransferase (isomerizing)
VLGVGEGVMLAASDVPAPARRTPADVIFLEEGEIAEITLDGYAHRGSRRAAWWSATSRVITWTPSCRRRSGGYKHFMLKEIHEQPRAMVDTLRGRVSAGEAVRRCTSRTIRMDDAFARDIRSSVVILRMWHEPGTPALHGQEPDRVGSLGCPSRSISPASSGTGIPVVGRSGRSSLRVSQSGETADTLAALKGGKGTRRPHSERLQRASTAAIARAVATTLIYTHAGPEIGVASTKCFTAQLAALTLLAVHLGRCRGTLSEEAGRALLQEMVQVPLKMREVLGEAREVESVARAIAHTRDALFLGRGLSAAVALEGALKLKEISYVHAEGYAGGEMKHGPLALVDRNMPVVCLLPSDSTLEKMLSNVQEVGARDGQIIAVVDNRRVAEGLAASPCACPRRSSP